MSAGKSDCTLIPDWWIADILPKRPGAFRVACRLAHYANADGTTYVSATRIAKDLKLSREHVTRMLDDLRDLGAVAPTGRTIQRAREYRINVHLVTAPITGSGDDDCHTSEQRPVMSEPSSCDDGDRRPVTTAIHTNGTRTVIGNGMHAAPEIVLAEEDEAIEALCKVGIDRATCVALMAKKPELVKGWSRFALTDYPGIKNAPAFIVSKIKAGEQCISPERDPSETRRTYCGLLTCRYRHFSWEPCGKNYAGEMGLYIRNADDECRTCLKCGGLPTEYPTPLWPLCRPCYDSLEPKLCGSACKNEHFPWDVCNLRERV